MIVLFWGARFQTHILIFVREVIAVYDVIGNGAGIGSLGSPYGAVFDVLFFRTAT